jgi:microcystin-dependent protein
MPSIKASDQAAALGTFVPAGVVIPFAGATAPSGWLLCNGSPISRTTYAALFSAIATSWGDGTKNADGSPSGFSGTHFNLPDLRGRFLRGLDGGIARDPDRAGRTAANTGGNTGDAVGSVQGDQYRSHAHPYNPPNYDNANNGSNGCFRLGANFIGTTEAGASVAANGGNETRPINANVNYIIKY